MAAMPIYEIPSHFYYYRPHLFVKLAGIVSLELGTDIYSSPPLCTDICANAVSSVGSLLGSEGSQDRALFLPDWTCQQQLSAHSFRVTMHSNDIFSAAFRVLDRMRGTAHFGFPLRPRYVPPQIKILYIR